MRARWTAMRNRLLASARFRRLASAAPPTRAIASAHAGALFDLVAGFVYSQVALAFLESGLLDALAAPPTTADDAAKRAGLSRDATLTLLKAAAALKLAEPIGERWTLGTRGAALHGTPGLAAMIRHHRLLYADLADPLALLRGERPGQLANFWAYARGGEPAAVAEYSALMAATQPMIAEQIVAAYDFSQHRRLLDVGGGDGAFLAAVARTAPQLELGLFDLPAVADRARSLPGITAHAGALPTDPLPPGYDLISLVRVLHDHDDDAVMLMLRAVKNALPPGGRVLVAEPMAGTPGHEAAGDAYFGFYLAAMGSGRPRTADEIKTMLAQVGFSGAREHPTRLPLLARAITARVDVNRD